MLNVRTEQNNGIELGGRCKPEQSRHANVLYLTIHFQRGAAESMFGI